MLLTKYKFTIFQYKVGLERILYCHTYISVVESFKKNFMCTKSFFKNIYHVNYSKCPKTGHLKTEFAKNMDFKGPIFKQIWSNFVSALFQFQTNGIFALRMSKGQVRFSDTYLSLNCLSSLFCLS